MHEEYFQPNFKKLEIPEFEDLKAYLREEHNGRIASGGNQIIIRCPYCGDSREMRNAHLYIGPDRKKNDALAYFCFLCARGGLIGNDFFRQIQCYDVNLISEILDYNEKVLNRPKSDYIGPLRRPSASTIINRDIDYTYFSPYQKLNYINDRLGVNLGFNDLYRYKIVLNLERYLRDNHIKGITRKREVLDELSNKHIGFLSADNTYMVMRALVSPKNLNKEIQTRYVNYILYPNRYLSFVYYLIPAEIDTTKEIHIHLAEGVFDILGVHFHCDKSKRTGNEIFGAAGGKANYMGIMKYIFVRLMIPACICTLDIYLDRESDGTLNFDKEKPFINEMKKMCRSVTLHANFYPGEKDFGVPADHIDDRIIPY